MVKLEVINIINIIKKFKLEEINSRSAEISFYLLLTIFPFLMFTISTIVYIPILHLNRYIGMLESIMPESAFNVMASIINSAIENKSIELIILSFLLTIWTSSRAVRGIIRGANKSYNIKETRSYIKVLITGLLFTLLLLFLIFSSMIFLVYGEKIGHIIFKFIGLDEIFIDVWTVCRYTIGISTVTIILISLYRYTPNKKVGIKEAIPGATIATFGWIIVSFAYSYYSNYYANYEMIYGSIAGMIVLITWLYLSSWAILMGCKINSIIYNINKRESIKHIKNKCK